MKTARSNKAQRFYTACLKENSACPMMPLND